MHCSWLTERFGRFATARALGHCRKHCQALETVAHWQHTQLPMQPEVGLQEEAEAPAAEALERTVVATES